MFNYAHRFNGLSFEITVKEKTETMALFTMSLDATSKLHFNVIVVTQESRHV